MPYDLPFVGPHEKAGDEPAVVGQKGDSPMIFRDLLFAILMSVVVCTSGRCAPEHRDDRFGRSGVDPTIGFMGHSHIQTPNLDRLAGRA
jgi:hypothetical protein